MYTCIWLSPQVECRMGRMGQDNGTVLNIYKTISLNEVEKNIFDLSNFGNVCSLRIKGKGTIHRECTLVEKLLSYRSTG